MYLPGPNSAGLLGGLGVRSSREIFTGQVPATGRTRARRQQPQRAARSSAERQGHLPRLHGMFLRDVVTGRRRRTGVRVQKTEAVCSPLSWGKRRRRQGAGALHALQSVYLHTSEAESHVKPLCPALIRVAGLRHPVFLRPALLWPHT